MLIKAILVAIWAGFCVWDQYGPHLGFRKPLLAGVVTGLILGDLKQGLIIGGTLELMWLGMNNVGAYIPPDVISGSVVGVAIGILTGQGVAAGVAVAIPVAMLIQQVSMFLQTFNITLVHRADKIILSGDYRKIDKLQYIGMGLWFLSRFIPVFLAVYLGTASIEFITNKIPESIFTGLSVASKIIPAVGMAMLLTMMMKKYMWMFLLLGFVIASYFQIPLLGLALLGLVFAGIYDLIITSREKNMKTETSSTITEYDSEEELDL